MDTKKTNETDKQAQVFANMYAYRSMPSNEELVSLMNRVAKARKWKGFQAKRFRMAVIEAIVALHARRDKPTRVL